MVKNQKGFANIVLVAVLIVAAGIAGYFGYQKYRSMHATGSSEYFQIKEWGVEFKTPADLKDLVYILEQNNSFASFSTKALMDLDRQVSAGNKTYCDPTNNPVGGIIRDSQMIERFSPSVYKTTGDGYYYRYETPQATCSDNKQVQALETKILGELLNSFSSLRKVNSTKNSISDWKIYTSTQYGLQFKYPNDWKNPSILNNMIRLGCPEFDFEGEKACPLVISFDVYKDKSQTIKDIESDGYSKTTEIKFQNLDAIEYLIAGEAGASGIAIFDKNNNRTIYFDDQSGNASEFNDILSTFKFTK